MPTPKKILSIDDSLTIRKLIENALKPGGYEVLLAASGEEGFRLAVEAQPDLILLDYVLPDVRGVEFCQRLSAEESTRHTPVLLISGHGSAIQELYRDCGNVVDYLTKPFAANVLQAVVANVLSRSAAQPAAGGASPVVSAPTAVTAALVDPLADHAGSTPQLAPTGDQGAVEKQQFQELRQCDFERLLARLHTPLPSIPAWEAMRGEQEPFSYYLSRLLPLDLLGAIAQDLVEAGRRVSSAGGSGSALALPSKPVPTLCGSTRFVSERHVLNHLLHEGVTGELKLVLPEEIVSVIYDAGSIVAISSNHPRLYCAGSSFPFLQVPHAVVSAAMLAQRESCIPFFVTTHALGVLASGSNLVELLRECGHRCLGRVYETPDLQFAFTPLTELPEYVTEHRVSYSLPQLLLESYRRVTDWQHIQEDVPSIELFVGRTAATEQYYAALSLNALESELLAQIDYRRTVAQLQEIVGQPLFDVCRALYCLVQLDLCYLSTLPLVEEERAEPAAEVASEYFLENAGSVPVPVAVEEPLLAHAAAAA